MCGYFTWPSLSPNFLFGSFDSHWAYTVRQLPGVASVMLRCSESPAPSVFLFVSLPSLPLSQGDTCFLSFSLSLPSHSLLLYEWLELVNLSICFYDSPSNLDYLKLCFISLFWNLTSFLSCLKAWKLALAFSVAFPPLMSTPSLPACSESVAVILLFLLCGLLQYLPTCVKMCLSFILHYLLQLLYPDFKSAPPFSYVGHSLLCPTIPSSLLPGAPYPYTLSSS